MTSYLKYGQKQDDFGNVDDEDLMPAETSDAPVALLAGQNPKRSFDFEDGSPSKRTQNRERIDFRCTSSEIILKDTWGFRNSNISRNERLHGSLMGGGQCCCRISYRRGMSLVYQITSFGI